MPSTITHEYHYRDVYALTKDEFKKSYPIDLYRLYSVGAQGHDAYFFLDFWDLPHFKKKCAQAELLQDEKFQNICIYISKLIMEECPSNKEIRLILYGYILHHLLDSYVHPYIIYETESSGLHAPVESYLDEWMIEKREDRKAQSYPVYKLIPMMPKLSKETKDILNRAFLEIYGIDSFGHTYGRALRQVPVFLRLFRFDFTGIKQLGYKIVDCTHLSSTKYYWLSYHNRFENYEYYLNEEHRTWYNPATEKESTLSFYELYELAVEDGAEIISKLDMGINSNATIEELENIIPRVSSNPIIGKDKKILKLKPLKREK